MLNSLTVLDQYRLNFSAEGLHLLNVCLAIVMFGIALEIDLNNLKQIFQKPKAYIIGLLSQFIVLPLITFLLVLLIRPSESVALGMILVAACPGGNISNFISSLAKGNIELSLTLTGSTTILSVLLTPLNFSFWGNLYANQSELMMPIRIDLLQMLQTVFFILGLPLAIGIIFSRNWKIITRKIQNPIKILSIIIFISFVAVALSNNFKLFLRFVHLIFLLVLLHNTLALVSGYFMAKIVKLDKIDRRTISIETGIQNSGLALVLIFNPKIFPEDLQLGGMAFIAAWWGIWHIISGLGVAYFWGRTKK